MKRWRIQFFLHFGCLNALEVIWDEISIRKQKTCSASSLVTGTGSWFNKKKVHTKVIVFFFLSDSSSLIIIWNFSIRFFFLQNIFACLIIITKEREKKKIMVNSVCVCRVSCTFRRKFPKSKKLKLINKKKKRKKTKKKSMRGWKQFRSYNFFLFCFSFKTNRKCLQIQCSIFSANQVFNYCWNFFNNLEFNLFFLLF